MLCKLNFILDCIKTEINLQQRNHFIGLTYLILKTLNVKATITSLLLVYSKKQNHSQMTHNCSWLMHTPLYTYGVHVWIRKTVTKG